MQPRVQNPAQSVPGAMDALMSVAKVAKEAAANAGVPASTVDLVETRASQINGCAVCLDMHTRAAWEMAAKHVDEPALVALVLNMASSTRGIGSMS